ncbi:MAG: hypothetical protein AB1816_13570 [Bacillota bacterium]
MRQREVLHAFLRGAGSGRNTTRTLEIVGDTLCSCDVAVARRLSDGSFLVRGRTVRLGGAPTQHTMQAHIRELVRFLEESGRRYRITDDLYPEGTARARVVRRALGL